MQASGARAAEIASEEREVAALRAGDERAFLALVKRHHRAMLQVATLYVRSRTTAEDVVQETWVRVLNGLELFERRSTLRSWIFRILVNCAKTRGVQEARTIPLPSFEPSPDEGPFLPAERFQGEGDRWPGGWVEFPAPWPDAQVESKELLAIVAGGLDALPPAQRTVMSLRDVEGWDSGEVCELLGITEGNQRVLLHRARSKVRAFVEERLGGRDSR